MDSWLHFARREWQHSRLDIALVGADARQHDDKLGLNTHLVQVDNLNLQAIPRLILKLSGRGDPRINLRSTLPNGTPLQFVSIFYCTLCDTALLLLIFRHDLHLREFDSVPRMP